VLSKNQYGAVAIENVIASFIRFFISHFLNEIKKLITKMQTLETMIAKIVICSLSIFKGDPIVRLINRLLGSIIIIPIISDINPNANIFNMADL
jgi:hypothetical protein